MLKNNLQIVVLNSPNISNFAIERNKHMFSSKAKWIFFIDADEKLTANLKHEIYDSIKNKDFDCYQIIRKNYFLGSYVGKDKIIRLIKKGSGNWVRGVHETFKVLPKMRVGVLRNNLYHNTANDLFSYISKIGKYSSIHARENDLEGKKPYLIKIIFYPIAKFITIYLKSHSVVFGIMQSLHSFLAWSDLWIIKNNEKNI